MEPTATNLLILALLSLAVGGGIAWIRHLAQADTLRAMRRRLDLDGHRWSE